MKNILFYICGVLVAVNSYSQGTIVDTSKVWSDVFVSMWGSGTSEYHKISTTDTIIDSMSYRNVQSKIYGKNDWVKTSFYLSENGGKVHFLKIESGTITRKGLLYDFTMNVGDTTYFGNTLNYCDTLNQMVLTEIKNITVNGVVRKQYKYEHTDGLNFPEDFYAITGIGSKAGLLETFSCQYDMGRVLLCVDSADVQIYKSHSDCYVIADIEPQFVVETKIHFNNNRIVVSSNEFINNIELFNALGQNISKHKINARETSIAVSSNSKILILKIEYRNGATEAKKIVLF